MSFATSMQSTASRLLTKYGEQLTITRKSQGMFNPVDGSTSVPQLSSFEVLAHPSSYTKQEIDGVNVLFGDVKILAYSSTPILINDVVRLDDTDYRLMSVEKIKAQGSVIVYKLQARV